MSELLISPDLRGLVSGRGPVYSGSRQHRAAGPGQNGRGKVVRVRFRAIGRRIPPVKKLNSQTSFPPLPPAPSIFQKMRDGACDPSPGFFYKVSDSFLSLVARPSLLDLSLLVGGPLAGIPVGGAGRRLVGVVGALRPPVLPAHLPPPARNRRWRRGWGGGCRQMFSPPASPARRCEFLRCRRSVGLWSEAGRVVLIRGSGKGSGSVRALAVIE